MKHFIYRNIEIGISLMTSGGSFLVEGLSGKFKGVTAITTDSEIYDLCQEKDIDGRHARWSAYQLLRSEYFSNL